MEGSKEDFPWKGSNEIVDTMQRKQDFNNKRLNLFTGTYTIGGSCNLELMIRKGPHLSLDSYALLNNFKHDSALLILDHYTEAGNQHRIILPQVDGSFSGWLEMNTNFVLFDASGNMTNLFKNMIADFFGLIEKLHKSNLVLSRFDKKTDLYVKVLDGLPKLLILLTEVKLDKTLGEARQDQNHIYEFMVWCAKQSNTVMNVGTSNFCNFIKESRCTSEKLRNYPDDWDDTRKGEYLMAINDLHPKELDRCLKGVDIEWPFTSLPKIQDNLPELLSKIVDYQRSRGREYNLYSSSEYANILRNSYKHFKDLPIEVKFALVNRIGLVKKINAWSPQFWMKAFERIG